MTDTITIVAPPFHIDLMTGLDEDLNIAMPQFVVEPDSTTPYDFTDSVIEMYVRPTYDHEVDLLVLTSEGENGIFKDDPAAGYFSIYVEDDEIRALVPAGDWVYFIRLLEPDDSPDGYATSELCRGAFKVVPGRIDGAGGGAAFGEIAIAKLMTASETIADYAFVSVHSSSGAKVRNADADAIAKEAVGFVKAGITSGQQGRVYFAGINDGLAGLTPGTAYYLSATAGGVTATAPSTSGQIVQRLGVAISDTELPFQPAVPVLIA